jgi:hypothetical protein
MNQNSWLLHDLTKRSIAIERVLRRAGAIQENDIVDELNLMQTEQAEAQQLFWAKIKTGSEIQLHTSHGKGKGYFAVMGIVISKSEEALKALTFIVTVVVHNGSGSRRYKKGGTYCEAPLYPEDVMLNLWTKDSLGRNSEESCPVII